MRPLLFLSRLHKATRQIGLRLEGVCRELGVSNSEGHLLTYLAGYAPCPIGELRRVFGHKGSTLTAMLDRLEKGGLLRRVPNPEDRRSVLLEIEADGGRVAKALREEIEDFESQIRNAITDHDLAGFREVLDAIASVTQIQVRPEEPT